MTDAEHAAVLRGYLDPGENLSRSPKDFATLRAAIERAIELLDLEWDWIPRDREELRRLVMEGRNKP